MKSILAFFLIFLLFGCKNSDMKIEPDLSDVNWDKVNNVSIFFGHQSVGRNILDGLRLLQDKYPEYNLPIFQPGENSPGPGIRHDYVGQNFDPESKIEAFSSNQDYFSNNSVAALKFCYVDIGAHTDIDRLFSDYTKMVEEIERKNPELKIVHFTSPLTVDERDWKTLLKRMLGKKIRGYADNLAKKRYNEKIRATYGSSGLVFDIAEIESVNSRGEILERKIGSETYRYLAAEYTDDGGHLNEYGSMVVAAAFVQFISDNL